MFQENAQLLDKPFVKGKPRHMLMPRALYYYAMGFFFRARRKNELLAWIWHEKLRRLDEPFVTGQPGRTRTTRAPYLFIMSWAFLRYPGGKANSEWADWF
jgi:hypothetical protein